jgi:hypothetical protein
MYTTILFSNLMVEPLFFSKEIELGQKKEDDHLHNMGCRCDVIPLSYVEHQF